jgi:flagellar M-ring protein FliF
MKEQLVTLGRRVWNDFRAFSTGQKAVTIVAGIALLVGGLLFATWKSKPSYAPLYTNLAATDASAIVDKLNTAKIPYQLGAAGTEILVPKDKVYSTRLTVSAAGLPSSSQTGYSLLDKEGVTTSEFKQQVDYQRAIEGELAKTIQAINGVNAASVHLAIPQQDVFNDGTQKPTAAVLLSTAAGTHLTSQQVQSVVYLVSSSVPNMGADSVTVADSDGTVLAAAGSGVTDAAGTSTQTQATQDYNNRLSTKLQNLINAAVGAGHAVVTVNADLDFDKTSTTKNSYTYDPKAPPLSKQSTTEKYTGNHAGSGGTLGSGTAATTGSGTSGGGSYTKTNDTVDNALGTVTETTQNAPGSVKKQAIAVLLDGSVPNVNVSALEALVRSAVGLDATRGDTLAIQAMPFNTSQAKAAAAASAAAAKAAAARTAHAHMVSMIRQGALAALVLGVLLATWLANRRRNRNRDGQPPFVNENLFADEPIDLAPPADPEQLAVVLEFQEAAARRRALVALADEQPQDVARVLSGWLSTKEG